MINKIFKRIHNRYSNIFKFFFYLRYVFLIFIVASSIFFLIPKFFNFEKKIEVIKSYLNDYYNLELKEYKKVEFNIFPFPNLLIESSNLKIENKFLNLKSKKLYIFLHIKNIYNFDNFKAKKIVLLNNELRLDVEKSKGLLKYLTQLNHKLDIKNLNIYLEQNNKSLLKIKNINFANYGYKKYQIAGEILDRKFKASLKNNNKSLYFKILKTGVKAKFEFDDNNSGNSISGSSKINLLNNILKFDFNFNDNEIKILKSNFRNRNLSLSLDSLLKFKPYFNSKTSIRINEIEQDLINKINIEKILNSKNIIKKLNSEIKINYNNKKYFTQFVDNYSYDLNFTFGRLVFSKKTKIVGGLISCQGDSFLLEDFPRLNFNCILNLDDKKRLFKKLDISKKIDADILNINVEGSLNLLNQKVNFKKIQTNKGYLANKEDTQYFQDNFQKIFLDKNIFYIFNEKKIKEFLLEII